MTRRFRSTARRSAAIRVKNTAAVTRAMGGCITLGNRGIVAKTIRSDRGEW
jgi:hypothetical protein